MSFKQPKVPSRSQGPKQESRYVCPMDSSHRIPINASNNVLSHLVQQHGLNKIAHAGTFVFHREPLRPGVDILLVAWRFDEKDFLQRISVDLHGYIRISITIIGNKQDSERYTAELQLIPKPNTGQPSDKRILLTYPQLRIQPLRNESEPPTFDSSIVIQDNWFRINYPACMAENYRMEWISKLDIMKEIQFSVDELCDSIENRRARAVSSMEFCGLKHSPNSKN